jgi:hypothetical protein
MQIRTPMLLALAGIVTAGCSDANDPNSEAQVRALHAAATVANVDVLVGGTVQAPNISYRAESQYRAVGAGKQKVQVRQNGTTTALVESEPTLTDGAKYTIVVVKSEGNTSFLLLRDDAEAPPSGKAKLRVVNVAPAAPKVDVYVTAPGANLANATAAATNLDQNAATQYAALSAGTYQLRFTSPGTKTVLYDAGNVVLAAGQTRTLVIVDKNGGGTPLEKVVLADLN